MPYCVAVGCQNASGGRYAVSGLSWHTFPLDDQPLLRKWLHNMGRKDFVPSKSSRLCGAHFKEDDFVADLYEQLMGEKRARTKKHLKPGAVPTLFSHRPPSTIRKHTVDRCRRLEQTKVSGVFMCPLYYRSGERLFFWVLTPKLFFSPIPIRYTISISIG